MPWARFDDRFPSNRKIRLLSDGAFRLYVSAICWSAENLTDGVIKKTELRLVADVKSARTRAQQLVEHGLWEALSDGGWRIHDYHEYNPTAEQVRADRAAKTARQQRWREKRKSDVPPPQPPSNRPDVDASTDASRNASRDGARDAAPRARIPDPTRPDPSVGSGEGRERADRSSAHEAQQPLSLIPADWTPSPADRAAAAADMHRLGAKAVDHATAKFIRHHQSTGTRRANYGPAWVTWLSRERAGTQGAFLVGLPGGSTPTPPSFRERMAELEAAAARDDREREGDTA